MEFNIDELKLKTTSQLNDDEKTYLKSNLDKLNEEDKEAYADFLKEDEVDNTQSDNETQTEEKESGRDEGGESHSENNIVVNDKGQDAPYQFKSEEEAKAFVLKVQEEEIAAKQKAIDSAKTPEEKKYVDDNWKPQDWNEGLKKAVEIAKSEIKLDAENERKRIEEQGKELDRQWKELEKENNLPSISTKEGKDIHDQIVNIGLQHNKTTFKDAHDLWAMIPKEKGGGYDASKEIAQKKKEVINSQKKAAAKLSGQGDSVPAKQSGSLDVPDYETLHGARSTNELLKKVGVI